MEIKTLSYYDFDEAITEAINKKIITEEESGLGLSDENINRLTKGQPILINDNDLKKLTGWDGYILIMHGKTEEAMEQEINTIFVIISMFSVLKL
jgi:hypothetical protein